jgi:hypothetical protein
MKTTMGQVRGLLRDARYRPKRPADTGPWTKEKAAQRGVPFHEKVTEHDGFKPGDWVMVHGRNGREHAGEVKGFTMVHAPGHEPFLMIDINFGGHSSSRRYDIWKTEDYSGPATAADVEEAKASWEAENAYMAKHIDTSREGT